ncbi:40S ribosomal protein SA [Trichonephila clavipes]|nr:40S ribosomal protein SA [Trichonephila clavipes]
MGRTLFSEAIAENCAKTIIEEVPLRYGLPRRIIRDNGPHFISAVMQLTCDLLDIAQDLFPVYHPPANPSECKNHREGPYLILTLRSPVTYEIADPANPDQALVTYHVSALKDYQELETERNTGFVASLKKRGHSKEKLLPGSEPRRQQSHRGSVTHGLILRPKCRW